MYSLIGYMEDILKAELLKKLLRAKGASFLRQGGNHEIWVKGNKRIEVPRHTNIKDNLAKRLLKDAEC